MYYYLHYCTRGSRPTPKLPTNIVDFRGFDSSTISQRGGIPRFMEDFPESLSQAMLVGTMLVGRLGLSSIFGAEGRRASPHLESSARSAPQVEKLPAFESRRPKAKKMEESRIYLQSSDLAFNLQSSDPGYIFNLRIFGIGSRSESSIFGSRRPATPAPASAGVAGPSVGERGPGRRPMVCKF